MNLFTSWILPRLCYIKTHALQHNFVNSITCLSQIYLFLPGPIQNPKYSVMDPDPRWSKFILQDDDHSLRWRWWCWHTQALSRGMYALHYPNIEKNTQQPYTMHTFTQLWRKKCAAEYNDYNIQHDIKHNHACGSLSWLLFFYRIPCHVPTESSYQQWRQTGLMRSISGLPSIDQTSLCAHWQIWVWKIMPGVEM